MLKTYTITEGDSYFIKIELLKEGQAWPVMGWKFWFTVKRDTADADADAVTQKSTDDDTIRTLTITSAYVIGSPTDTKGKEAGRCRFDIQAQSPEGEIYTLEHGFVLIKAETTKAA